MWCQLYVREDIEEKYRLNCNTLPRPVYVLARDPPGNCDSMSTFDRYSPVHDCYSGVPSLQEARRRNENKSAYVDRAAVGTLWGISAAKALRKLMAEQGD